MSNAFSGVLGSRAAPRATRAVLGTFVALAAVVACSESVLYDDYSPYVAVVYGTISRDGVLVTDVRVEAVIARDSATREFWTSAETGADGSYRLEVLTFSPGPYPIIVQVATEAASVRSDSLRFSRIAGGPTDSARVDLEL